MKRFLIVMAVLCLALPACAERWEYSSFVGDTIHDPIPGPPADTFDVKDSIYVPIHAIISDINFFVDIETQTDADKIDVIVYSPQGVIVYLSHWNPSYPRRYFFEIWFDTEDSVDGPGSLADYVGQDVCGWWKMRCYSMSPGGPDAYWREWRIEVYGTTTGVNSEDPDIPKDYFLSAATPNPFNASTGLSFGLPHKGVVSLEVFDILGRRIATLIDREYPAGVHEVTFDATEYASGIYLCRLSAGGRSFVRKLSLLK